MLAEILPKIAAMENREYDFRPRPSLAGPERCIRQMVFWGMGVPRAPMPGRAIMVFDDSSWHEELTADWLRKTAYKFHSQQMPVQCRAPMGKGLIDGIVTDIEGVDRLLEHKAISHFSFQRLWEGSLVWEKPLPMDYLTQTAIYLDGLQKINPEIEEGILLAKNKNTAQYVEYRIKYSWDSLGLIEIVNSQGERREINTLIPNIYQSAIDKFNEVMARIAERKLPKRQYGMDDWHCKYCGWYGECWKNYEQEFNDLPVDVVLDDGIAEKCKRYKELGEAEKEKKELSKELKALMVEKEARKARAGEYIISRSLQKRKDLDKELIPADVLVQAEKESMFEKLTVSKGK